MDFTKDIENLNNTVEIIFDVYVVPELINFKKKFKDDILISQTSIDVLTIDILKPNTKRVFELLAKNYIKLLTRNYLTKEGLIDLIFHRLYLQSKLKLMTG